jgi:hypothetical protein
VSDEDRIVAGVAAKLAWTERVKVAIGRRIAVDPRPTCCECRKPLGDNPTPAHDGAVVCSAVCAEARPLRQARLKAMDDRCDRVRIAAHTDSGGARAILHDLEADRDALLRDGD